MKMDVYINSLIKIPTQELVKQEERNNDWIIKEDIVGEDMIFYKGVPVDEIIYCVGEISLAMTSNLATLQKEYYEDGSGNVFNIALKLIRDTKFAKEFYEIYKII